MCPFTHSFTEKKKYLPGTSNVSGTVLGARVLHISCQIRSLLLGMKEDI